jgi:hypothetical protein
MVAGFVLAALATPAHSEEAANNPGDTFRGCCQA